MRNIGEFLNQRDCYRKRLAQEWPLYKNQQSDCSRRLTAELEHKLRRCFTPWVGGSYCNTEVNASGLRIPVLVVGDSTYRGLLPEPVYKREYADDGADWFNKNAIFPYRNGYWRDAYFTKWTDALLCNSVNERDRQQCRQSLLDSVAFCNFCDSILDGPRMAPQAAHFDSGEWEFGKIIEILKPHLVVLTSYRVRDTLLRVRNDGVRYEQMRNYEGGYRLIRELNHQGPPILCLPHPAAVHWWKKAEVQSAVQHAMSSQML